MKKIFAALLCFVLILSFAGCGAESEPKEPTADSEVEEEKPQIVDIVDLTERDGLSTDDALEEFFKDEAYTYYFPSIRSEYIVCTLSDGTTMPIKEALEKGIASIDDLKTFDIKFYKQDSNGNYIASFKEVLRLQYLPHLSIEQTEPAVESVDIAYSPLTENEGERYTNNPELQGFAEYVENNFNIELDKNWEVFIHYYDIDKTTGMVQFQYFIGDGEIGTNKSIIFNLNNGKVDMIFHSCLEGSTNEEALQNRVQSFKAKYVQEQYQLKAGEEFSSETVNFTFNYDTGDLIYCYSVFFTYDEGFINNDYGTTCFIDENGNALQVICDGVPLAPEGFKKA